MQRLQHYNTVPSLQDLHSCLSDIYLKKNALKKEGKQAPYDLISIIFNAINTWDILKEQSSKRSERDYPEEQWE